MAPEEDMEQRTHCLESLIQETINRVDSIVEKENSFQISAEQVKTDDHKVADLLFEIRHLLNRMALDARLTLRTWQFWLSEGRERIKELEKFKKFQTKQIELAVKSEAHKNLMEVQERRGLVSEAQLKISKLQQRIYQASLDREKVVESITQSSRLLTIAQSRMEVEGQAAATVESKIERIRNTLANSRREQREAQATWETLLDRASQEQKEHLTIIKLAENKLDAAQKLLNSEEAVCDKDDKTDKLRQEVEVAVEEQKAVKHALNVTLESKERTKEEVLRLQEIISKENDAAAIAAEEYRQSLAKTSSSHDRMAADMEAQRKKLEQAQLYLQEHATALRREEDAVFGEQQQVNSLQNIISGNETKKAALTAELQRMATQRTMTVEEYDQVYREVMYHREQVSKIKDTMQLNERGLKHDVKKAEEELAAEVELREDIESALKQVRIAHGELKQEREIVLRNLNKSITDHQSMRTELVEKEKTLAKEVQAKESQHDILQKEHVHTQEQLENTANRLSTEENTLRDIHDMLSTEKSQLCHSIETAADREEAAKLNLEQKQAELEVANEILEEMEGTIASRSSDIKNTRSKIQQSVAETKNMIDRRKQLEQEMNDCEVRHSEQVKDLHSRIKETKRDTRQLILDNNPVALAYRDEQHKSFSLRQTMSTAIARELELEIQIQQHREAAVRQQQLAYSQRVYCLLDRHKARLGHSLQIVQTVAGVGSYYYYYYS